MSSVLCDPHSNKRQQKIVFSLSSFFVRVCVCVILFGWLDFHPQWRHLRPSPKTCSSFIPSLPGESFANVNANVLDVSSTILLCFVLFILFYLHATIRLKQNLSSYLELLILSWNQKKKKKINFLHKQRMVFVVDGLSSTGKDDSVWTYSSARMATLYPHLCLEFLDIFFFFNLWYIELLFKQPSHAFHLPSI